jgi:hypothetical protein
LDYSIEPMINPGDSSFYLPYILVTQGQEVSKGETIATFYTAPGNYDNPHIHFHLRVAGDSNFYAPEIFTQAVVDEFCAKWGDRGEAPGGSGNTMPASMGYLLESNQTLFP